MHATVKRVLQIKAFIREIWKVTLQSSRHRYKEVKIDKQVYLRKKENLVTQQVSIKLY